MFSHKFIENCKRKLEDGNKKFNLELAIVSQIENDTYMLIAVDDSSNTFKSNDVFPLGDTYCRDVINRACSVALPLQNQDVQLKQHPLYGNMPLEAYISSPILHNGKIWGTINFSAKSQRPEFSTEDIEFNERLAADISACLCEEVE